MEYNIALSNGQILKGIIKSPGDNLRALVIMVHGHGEHILRYDHWAELFNGSDIGLTGVDLPGHGRSEGKRGHVRDGDLLMEMIDIMIDESNKTFSGLPLFLYGHSLGGSIVLNYLLTRNPKIKGAIVTDPTLRLAFEPGKSKLVLAAIMKSILPGLVQQTGLPVNYLSHDREIIEKYINDPLVHDKMSVSLFHTMMSFNNYSLSHASELNVPLLLVHGGEDKICSPNGSIEFAVKTKMAELKIWEGGYHELHNEPFKKEVFDFLISWINKKIV
ncbi:MAG: lysophospholipase [Bacteroidales bacterium]|jgi:alpha-beta hydrolase superfamily lysophospholipase|nr:lysophospholipase [Bacteroidales bacterium]